MYYVLFSYYPEIPWETLLSHCIPGITLLDTSKESGLLGGGRVPLNALSSQDAFSACIPYAAEQGYG